MGDSRGKPHASLARIKAYECLEVIRRRDAFAHETIERVINSSKLSKQDRAFSTRLVIGVVMMRGSLDYVLDRCMRSPSDVQPNVRSALRISAYELIYLGKSPHVAIDQGVELVRFAERRAAGLANAVLRKVAGAAKSFPFGDPAGNLGVFALMEGFPLWLAQVLADEIGEPYARRFMHESNEPAPIFVSVNPLDGHDRKTSSEICSIDRDAASAEIEGHVVCGCLRLGTRSSLADGRFQRLLRSSYALVSDASSQYIVQLSFEACLKASDRLRKTRDLSCLELCAGRGTKTVLLQSAAKRLSGRQFKRFVAVDNMEFKVKLLQSRAESFGAHLTAAICKDACKLTCEDIAAADEPDAAYEPFDLVFIDAPCTGLGTIRRHPEIRWRIKPETIVEDARRDVMLLRAASRFVAAGGVLAYSTCTVTSQENELAVRSFLDSEEGGPFKLIPIGASPVFKGKLDAGGPDAHFCALMLRTA